MNVKFIKIRNFILKLLKIMLLYFIICLLLIEFYYSLMGFNSHTYYTDDIKISDFGLECEEKQLMTSDEIMIHTYQVHAGNPKGVIIILTGIQWPDVKYYLSHSKLFLENGYSSVLIDARGHGKSEGDKITFGIEDVRDVSTVVDDLVVDERYNNLPIIVMGVSMGGATAINSASLLDDIDGLISMSAFSSWNDVCIDTLEFGGFHRCLGNLLRPALSLHGFLNYGIDYFKISPKNTIKQIGNKPIMLIHSKCDVSVPVFNYYRIIENYNGNNLESWIRDSESHFIINNNDILNVKLDEEYCSRLINYLHKNFE